MAAHTEMEATSEAARLCVFSTIQAMKEFERLKIKISIND
jgi:hypothetical protein